MPKIDPQTGTPGASEAARAEAKGGRAQQTGSQPGHPSVSASSALKEMMWRLADE